MIKQVNDSDQISRLVLRRGYKSIADCEPELGLHPFAISLLGGLMKSAAQQHQLIVSTQSVELVNEFDAEDLIVIDKRGGTSTFKRPDSAALAKRMDGGCEKICFKRGNSPFRVINPAIRKHK